MLPRVTQKLTKEQKEKRVTWAMKYEKEQLESNSILILLTIQKYSPLLVEKSTKETEKNS